MSTDTVDAFQAELVNDLEGTQNDLNLRLTALADTVFAAMNKIDSDNFTGSATSSSTGDTVIIEVTNMNVNVCLVFFMCESSVDADVYMHIENDGGNGNYADITFRTQINAESMDVNSIRFRDVDSAQDLNTFSGAGYDLKITAFNFNRPNGLLDLEGSGSIEDKEAVSPRTNVLLTDYKIRVYLKVLSNTNFSFIGADATLNGTVNTRERRSFKGNIILDRNDKNLINGKLTGLENEPVIDGEINTSVSYDDVKKWGVERANVNVVHDIPYFSDSNGLSLVKSVTEFGGRMEANDFNNNRYECNPGSAGVYQCSGYNQGTKTLKFTKSSEVMIINTNQGDYYVIDAKNINSSSPTKFSLFP